MPLGFRKLIFPIVCAGVCGWLCGFEQNLFADTVRRGLGPEPDSLHIHRAQGLASMNLLRDLREGLVTFDAAGELVPGVAASWQIEDSGRRYVFTLRPDARWSNGDPVTAEDFVRHAPRGIA
jgi:oligopeptide transport system substrate-binding protein